MSVDRRELYELIDQLPEDQVAPVADELRRRTRQRSARTTEPFDWIGMIADGPSDASSPERIDEVLASGFGRRSADQ